MNVLRFLISQVLLLAGVSMTLGQTAGGPPQSLTPSVTISPSAEGVRFVALGSVKGIRLEVLGADGEPVYNSGFARGNLRDWKLEDAQGQRLPDGSYLCVVTVRDLAGQVGVRQGSILIQGGKASLQLLEGAQAGPLQAEKGLAAVAQQSKGPTDAVALTAHDGRDGQVVSTEGALSFRTGDFFAGRDRERMRLTEDGRLGVGTPSPEDALDVAGTIRARGGIRFEDGTVLTSASQTQAKALGSGSPSGGGEGALASGTGTANRLARWLDGAGTLGDSAIFESNGNLGLGTTTPASKLDMIGSITFRHSAASGGFRLGDRAADPGRQLVFAAASGSPYSVFNTFVTGSTLAAPQLSQFSAWTSDIDINSVQAVQFAFRHSPALGGVVATIPYGGATAGNVSIQANYTDSINPITPTQLVAATNGNVGVGTASPQSKLDVVGDLKVSGNAVVDGNIAAKYQDVAEWVPATEEMSAGTVVILDVTRSNTVGPSSRAYDTHVAGVVSAQPGVILGEGGDGKVLVATTGRVKVKVDATRRAIRVGDLLVTSGRPGVAMRSVPVRAGRAMLHRPGTIIGKALEPLAGGEGEILVLLSMQ